MGEETSVDKKSPEMTPQEDGTKVPLTDGVPIANIEEAKFVSNPNGEAKIDVGVPPAFSGLTKEELMKYSNDPFWIRLRWFLFVLFWLGWLAMLVVAIVIIVQAPGCKPPPELLWVEENVAVQVDRNALPNEKDLLSKCTEMGVNSIYFPDLISTSNFQELNYEAQDLIKAIVEAKKSVVTDLPSSVDPNNPFYLNATSENLINSNGTWNYDNEKIAITVYNEIVSWWIDQGVKGFLIETADTPEKKMFKDDLNELAKESDGAVGSDIVDTTNEIGSPTMFRDFLDVHCANWTFNKFNPNVAVGSTIGEDSMDLVTIGLFLSVGTPILNNYATANAKTSELIKFLSHMKTLSGIKFGNVNFVNSTDDVIAYTRVYKGTPAYAVALNFNDASETVSFADTPNVGETGNVEIHSTPNSTLYETREKFELSNIELGPQEGIVLQFVASLP